LREQLENFLRNMGNLGVRRLAGLGAAFMLLMAGIGVSAVYLNKPAYETLYVGLDRDDINRVGIALGEAGFKFDVDDTGTSVLVASGTASQARMVLAEKGLPASSGAGYELFDNLGSLGLTSFMQEVTRVRALEGEISRSIQSINGVKAARVHIVMPDRTAFRDRDRKPTASILIKADNDQIAGKAQAIRHLVAAAVPGLASEDVVVLDSTGRMLASGQDQFANAMTGSLDMQRQIENNIEEKVALALGPQLGAFNYRVGIQAQIDTDRSSTQETIFDPASRVERSIQVVRSEDSSTQKSESQNTSIEQNLPQAKPPTTASGPLSAETSQKREETTNYEINSKKVDTERNGYQIKRLSISIVVNKGKLTEILGTGAQQVDIDARLAEIQKIVSTASGFDETRGDKINVSAAEFVEDAVPPTTAPGLLEKLSVYTGTMINAVAFLVVALLILFFGIKPLIAAVSNQDLDIVASGAAIGGQSNGAEVQSGQQAHTGLSGGASFSEELNSIKPDIMTKTKISPAERLRAMTELDIERSALVLRKWLHEEAA
jgi:flagellar M-ring protein FliF